MRKIYNIQTFKICFVYLFLKFLQDFELLIFVSMQFHTNGPYESYEELERFSGGAVRGFRIGDFEQNLTGSFPVKV